MAGDQRRQVRIRLRRQGGAALQMPMAVRMKQRGRSIGIGPGFVMLLADGPQDVVADARRLLNGLAAVKP